MIMEEATHSVRGADHGALERALSHWDRMVKPLNGLGVLEGDIVCIAGASGSRHVSIDKKATVVMRADSGIIEEGVTQTGQEIIAIVAEDMGKGCSCVCLMAERAGVKVIPIDVGMNCYGEIPGVIPEGASVGAKNFPREPAMSREQTVMTMEARIRVTEGLKSKGYNLAGSGEMGIGNTTTNSAVPSALLDQDPGQMIGRGADLTTEEYKRKIRVIKDGIALRRPDKEDPVNVLSKVGRLDLAALTGLYVGCGAMGLPVVIDGLITGAAALAAVGICPLVEDYPLAFHISAEPTGAMVLKALSLKPAVQAEMCLGEGTGATVLFPLLDIMAIVYGRMSSFEEVHVEQYEHPK